MSLEINAVNPSSVWQVPPNFQSVYTHATKVSGGSDLLFVSGQFGVATDGQLPEKFTEQAEQAWANVEALLGAGGMSKSNVVKLNYFLVRPEDAADLVALRVKLWEGMQPPAVTVLTVSALARPEYLIEIEVTAVK